MSRPLDRRPMGCEWKAVYYSEGEATAAAARREERSEKALTSYWCAEHGGWHLTSAPTPGR